MNLRAVVDWSTYKPHVFKHISYLTFCFSTKESNSVNRSSHTKLEVFFLLQHEKTSTSELFLNKQIDNMSEEPKKKLVGEEGVPTPTDLRSSSGHRTPLTASAHKH